MKIEDIVKSDLNNNVKSGYGIWVDSLSNVDNSLGLYIYECNKFDNFKLKIYSKGFIYSGCQDDPIIKIMFEDIQTITSFLTTMLCSEISRTEDYSRLIPMIVICSDHDYEIKLPFVVYSAILITFNDCIKTRQASRESRRSD